LLNYTNIRQAYSINQLNKLRDVPVTLSYIDNLSINFLYFIKIDEEKANA